VTIAFLPRRTNAIGRLTRARSIVRGTVACLPIRKPEPLPTMNAGRWATLPGEYANAWASPLDERFPAITTPGTTAPVACGTSESVTLHLAGTWSGHVVFEGSADGIIWHRVTFACLTGDVVANECERPGLWRMLPDQHVMHFRLHVTHLSHGTILASIAAAPALGRLIPRSLDSAA
jgi:hypothetical protein